MKMRIIIAGVRKYDDYGFFENVIDVILKKLKKSDIEFVSGGATGIDTYAERYAKSHNIPIKVFPAEWDKYGNAAGPIRNKQMADYVGKNGLLIAFWDYRSRGTGNMVSTAEDMHIERMIVNIITRQIEGNI